MLVLGWTDVIALMLKEEILLGTVALCFVPLCPRRARREGILDSSHMVEEAGHLCVAPERDTGTFSLEDLLCVPFYLVYLAVFVFTVPSHR